MPVVEDSGVYNQKVGHSYHKLYLKKEDALEDMHRGNMPGQKPSYSVRKVSLNDLELIS